MSRSIQLLLINLACFVVVLSVLTPLLNSGDDAYCLYLMSGGFGETPTELTTYHHVLHPIITLGIKKLFIAFPYINWYGCILAAFHFFATSVILIQLYKVRPFNMVILIYTVFFVVFEIPFLLSINFTNTSIVITFAALTTLFRGVTEGKPFGVYYLIPIVMFILAGLFRIHTVIPLVGVTLPFLLANAKGRTAALLTLGLATGMVVLSNKTHELYYSGKKAGWVQDERYRQMLYKFYNDTRLFEAGSKQWETETDLIRNGLILDTAFLNAQKLSRIYADLHREKVIFSASLVPSVRWLLINNKIFILTALLLFLYASAKFRLHIFFSLVLLTIGVSFLITWLKLPPYILPAGIAAIFLLAGIENNLSKYGFIKLIPAILLLFWGGIRASKENKINVARNSLFVNAVNETGNSDHVFLIQDNSFPIDYIGAFDPPVKYRLTNIVWGSFDFNSVVLSRNNIDKISDIVFLPNLLMWGKPAPGLLAYFEEMTGAKLAFSEPLPEFKYGEVRRILIIKP